MGGGASGRSGGRESGRLGTDPLKLEASISNAFRGRGSALVSEISSIGAGLCTASKPSRGRLSDLKLSSCSCSLFLVQSSFH